MNLGGWKVTQKNSSKEFSLPADTLVGSGQYIVLGRDATKSAFQDHWGVTLGEEVIYLDSKNKMPVINGAEVFSLFDADGNVVDGPTFAIVKGWDYQRKQPVSPANQKASWTTTSKLSGATPGSGQVMGPDGIFISEMSDSPGVGNHIYEFVEIYVAGVPGDGGGPDPIEVTFTNDAQPIYKKHCSSCHLNEPGSGGHNIAGDYTDAAKPAKHSSCKDMTVAECSIVRIEAGHMPQVLDC
jgi:hypothetical protein